jgi:TRAP-type mannitol/chloroaromatic compound transport system permease large subunit
MSDPVVAVTMLGLFIFMVLLGFPIAFTLIAMGLGFGYYAYYDAERMQSIFDNRITYWWPSRSSYSWAMWSNGPT